MRLWQKMLAPELRSLTPAQIEIFEYGATEMINNVIEHASAKRFTTSLEWQADCLALIIKDDGIGIFKKIQQVLNFIDLQESLLALIKGKLTTDPDNHTGEGIYFTSRVFDKFSLEANGIHYQKDNIIGDWLYQSADSHQGTKVTLSLNSNSTRSLQAVFKKYSNAESYKFDCSEVIVKLAQLDGERFISRSQAKRLTLGLEKFKRVVLDFSKVETVGQGFVDEVFRVFQNKHKDIEITYENANENVEFMIKRSV